MSFRLVSLIILDVHSGRHSQSAGASLTQWMAVSQQVWPSNTMSYICKHQGCYLRHLGISMFHWQPILSSECLRPCTSFSHDKAIVVKYANANTAMANSIKIWSALRNDFENNSDEICAGWKAAWEENELSLFPYSSSIAISALLELKALVWGSVKFHLKGGLGLSLLKYISLRLNKRIGANTWYSVKGDWDKIHVNL